MTPFDAAWVEKVRGVTNAVFHEFESGEVKARLCDDMEWSIHSLPMHVIGPHNPGKECQC